MKRVAIVGAGIVGTTLAHHLAKAGHPVDLFEIGPPTPYPHTPQYEAEVLYANPFAPPVGTFPPKLPADIKGMSQSGDYGGTIDDERIMCVGGQATRWFGITPRLQRENFRPRTLHGFGADWPLSYDDLEPYYGLAEAYIGVSGSNDDNPFASPRSSPFPLPPFQLAYEDLALAERLKDNGIVTHTTPQARVRQDYDGRVACQNFGVCETCPIGARYSPNHHLDPVRKSPLISLHTDCLVRRIIVENGRGRGLVYHPGHGPKEIEHRADAIVIAAGAIESARLLLLSQTGGIHRDGIGNASGQVGRNLGFHHVWRGELTFDRPMMPGRAGPPTLLSHQFTAPDGKRNHGGTTVELFNGFPPGFINSVGSQHHVDGNDVLEALRPVLNKRTLTMNAETIPTPDKYMDLSGEKDRFGDRFAAVSYKLNDFDSETYASANTLAERFAKALDAKALHLDGIEQFWSAHHHMGTCRMGASLHDSVVDSFGAVHETRGLYIAGGATFVTVTPLQPTLTMVALAIRTAAHITKELAS